MTTEAATGIPEVQWLPPSRHLSPSAGGQLIDLKLVFHLLCWSGTSLHLRNLKSYSRRWNNETDHRSATGTLFGDGQQKAAGLRTSVSAQTDSPRPPPSYYSFPHLSGGRVAPEGSATSSHSTLCPPLPSPTPGSGSEDVWGDTMEVPLMYFLSLFPCTQEEQCVCACECV